MPTSLSEDQSARVRSFVQSGKYPSESAVVVAALEMLEHRQRFQEFVQEGVDAADRGDVVDHEVAVQMLRARSAAVAEMQAAQAK